MKRRDEPEPETPPVDRAKVRALLEEANALREAGENLHHHPIMERLVEASRRPLAVYVFAFVPHDHRLTSARLDELADGLLPRVAP